MYKKYVYFCTRLYKKNMTEVSAEKSEKKELEDLLKNIQEGLKKYSVKELNEAIINALNKKHDNKAEIDFIFSCVCKHFDISQRTIKQSKARGKVQDAKQICYCLLHHDLGLPIRFISQKIFFNWPTSVVGGLKRLKNADVTYSQDKEFIEAYKEIQKKLAVYVSTTKS